MHNGAKDQRRTEQRHNHAAIRRRRPGDVELRLEFIRHEPVPTSLQNSGNTGFLSLCDHHILAGRGIKIESGWTGLRKCDRPDPPTTKTHRAPPRLPVRTLVVSMEVLHYLLEAPMATDTLTKPVIAGGTTTTKVFKNFIDGEWVESTSGQTFEDRNHADTREG